jgi:hypothetical protein
MKRRFAHFKVLLVFSAAATAVSPSDSASTASRMIAFNTPTDTIVWPTLTEAQPAHAAVGETISLQGYGGYIRRSDGSYDESYRTFTLFFDGQPISTIGCYVNRCAGQLTIPPTTTPGSHQISTEGGSSLQLLVSPMVHRSFLPLVYGAG